MYYIKNEAGEYVEAPTKLYTEDEYKAVKTKNDEFRATNASLLKSNETLSAFASVLDGVQNLTPENLTKKIEELASKKAEGLVTDMKTKHQATLDELTQKLTGTSTQLSRLMLGTEVQKAGAKHRVVPTAYDDVLRRAESVFVVKDGAIAFKEEKLDPEGNPYTVDSWMAEQAKQAPHLFEKSSGPSIQRNTPVRTPAAGGNQDTRSPMEKLASGLSSAKSGVTKRLT